MNISLAQLKKQVLQELGSEEAVWNYWVSHSRREIDLDFQIKYNCSYYFAKKLFNEQFNFRDRTLEECQKIQRRHREATYLQRYGRLNVGQFGSIEHKKSIRQHYGVDNPQQAKIIKDKTIQTCLKKYGYKTNLIAPEFVMQKSKKYLYENTSFDSSWELAVWIYAIDHNEAIQRLPIQLYFMWNNEKHFYTPDFLYKGQLIEIKGSQFLDKNHNLTSPYLKNHKEIRTQDYYKAIQDCIEKNNVQLWSSTEIKPFLNYIKKMYGKDYLKQFKQI